MTIQQPSQSETTMATFQIENLPEELYSRIQDLAAKNNVTVNEAVIDLLKQACQPSEVETNQAQQTKLMSEVLQEIRSRPRVNPSDFGLPDSTVLIQEDRNR
jgi:plasmid stability protein